jgi:peptidoglycan-associated lipoprotein
MKSISTPKILMLVLSVLLLGGCESMSTAQTPPAEPTPPQKQATQTDSGEAAKQAAIEAKAMAEKKAQQEQAMAEQKAKEAAMKEQAALREIRTYYFDFDSSDVKPEASASLMAHATYLAANPSMKVTLDGYCDERGTKAYNMALGERRAKSVAQFLIVNGVSPSQIDAVSYGEEDPADPGHNEAAWAKNRRVVIHYR